MLEVGMKVKLKLKSKVYAQKRWGIIF